MDRGRLDGLDGLRGIAALAVFLSHVFGFLDGNAYLAVDFFFMLSGYVMARSYEPRMRLGGAPMARAFVVGRVRRLYPLVLLGSLAGLPWLFWKVPGEEAWIIAAACLVLIPYDGPTGPYMLNPPAWSIAFEIVANVLHAAFIARLGNRALGTLTLVLFGLLLVATRGEGLAIGPAAGSRIIVLMRVIAPYALGVLLYRIWRDRPPVHVPAWATWWAMPAFFAAGFLPGVNKSFADYLFVLALCPLLIAGGLRNGGGSRLAAFAGALSFPLYAVHGPVLLSLQALGAPEAAQVAAGLAAGLAAMCATAPGRASLRQALGGRLPLATGRGR